MVTNLDTRHDGQSCEDVDEKLREAQGILKVAAADANQRAVDIAEVRARTDALQGQLDRLRIGLEKMGYPPGSGAVPEDDPWVDAALWIAHAFKQRERRRQIERLDPEVERPSLYRTRLEEVLAQRNEARTALVEATDLARAAVRFGNVPASIRKQIEALTEGQPTQVADDGRRWWFIGSVLWPTLHAYAAPNGRAAIAAFRKALTEAETTNGRSKRDTAKYLQGARLYVEEGPLTTPEAYELDLGWALAWAVCKRSPLNDIPAGPIAVADCSPELTDEEIEQVRATVRRRYATVQPGGSQS